MIIITGILLILFAGYAALILFYAAQWRKIRTQKPVESFTSNATSISIIIPARNEEHNIEACLQSILKQNYPAEKRQVIVVDDHSTDGTASIVKKYAGENVLLISLADYVTGKINSYKKKAIETAMTFAAGELIVTTDADCIAPCGWLQSIDQFYEKEEPFFIAMPVAFTNDGSALQIFQSLDFLTLQGITGASVQAGAHSMCNGANMAYTKAAFVAVGGYAGVDELASGDDMLLMHKIARAYPDKIAFLKSRHSIMQTEPMQTWHSFLQQRIRWASKATVYNDVRITAVLFLVYFFNVGLLLLPLVAIFYNPVVLGGFTIMQLWMLLVLAKTLIELLFLIPVARFFGRQNLLWWFLPAQPFHILYTVVAGFLGKFGKYEWKGRRVK